MRGSGLNDLGNDIAFFVGNLSHHAFRFHAGADNAFFDLRECLFGLVPRLPVKLFCPLVRRRSFRSFDVRREARQHMENHDSHTGRFTPVAGLGRV